MAVIVCRINVNGFEPMAKRLGHGRGITAGWRAGLVACLFTSGVWASEGATPAPSMPRDQSVARLDAVWVFPQRQAPAVVHPLNESKLAAEAAGTLLAWTVDVGDTVRKGQVLARIDPEDARLALQRAQAQRDAIQARLQLEEAQTRRTRELVAQGFLSAEALNQRETALATVRTELASVQALVATAQRALDKTTLRAPFDGSVRQRMAQAGEAVVPGTVLYVLTQSAAPRVTAQIAPSDLDSLRAARHVVLEAEGRDWPLRLDRALPVLNAPERTQTVRLAPAERAVTLLPGQAGTLRWQAVQPHVPPQLLVRRGDALGLFVVQGAGTAQTVRFTALPGAQEGRATPVGLPADTRLVVQGQSALRDGQTLPAGR